MGAYPVHILLYFAKKICKSLSRTVRGNEFELILHCIPIRQIASVLLCGHCLFLVKKITRNGNHFPLYTVFIGNKQACGLKLLSNLGRYIYTLQQHFHLRCGAPCIPRNIVQTAFTKCIKLIIFDIISQSESGHFHHCNIFAYKNFVVYYISVVRKRRHRVAQDIRTIKLPVGCYYMWPLGAILES